MTEHHLCGSMWKLGGEMPRQAIYFTDKTLKELKEFIIRKHGAHRAMSITVQQAVTEFLAREKEKEVK